VIHIVIKMRDIDELIDQIISTLESKDIRIGLERSVLKLSPNPFNILKEWTYLKEYSEHLRMVKEKVFGDIEYYIDKTIESIERIGGQAYYASTKEEVLNTIDDIIGEEPQIIVKAKSMVSEEIGLRDYLIEKGHEVYETDLGELLLQLSKEKPMHSVAPAVHIPREKAIELLRKLDIKIDYDTPINKIVEKVRAFLRDKFINADVGISGANAIAADTGAIFLISNEGNIRLSTSLPPKHIVVTSIEKIMPTMNDAFIQVLVQAGYAGLYPPTYISIIAGPSSTADIEFNRVYGVHGPKEVHVILYDGGRLKALEDPYLSKQLYCLKCGRCQQECPIWELVGNIWGGKVYGGPMGLGWTAITENIEKAATLAILCLNCGRCKEVCPLKIDIPSISHYRRIVPPFHNPGLWQSVQ